MSRQPPGGLGALGAVVGRLGLTLHPNKTRIVRVEEGFDFPSFYFVRRRSPTTGRRSFYIFPSKDSRRRIRENIRSFTHRRAPVKPAELLPRINDAVRGWTNYFQHANTSEAFRGLQRFINRRVRQYLSQRHREARARVEAVPEVQALRDGPHLHRQWPHHIRDARRTVNDGRTGVFGKTERTVG